MRSRSETAALLKSRQFHLQLFEETADVTGIATLKLGPGQRLGADADGHTIGKRGKRALIGAVVAEVHRQGTMLEAAQFAADGGAFIAQLARQDFPDFLAVEQAKTAVETGQNFVHRGTSLARFRFLRGSIVDRERPAFFSDS